MRNKDVLDLTNAAAKVSLDTLGKAPEGTAWRVERSVLPKHEVQRQADVASTAEAAEALLAPTRQRVRACGPMQ